MSRTVAIIGAGQIGYACAVAFFAAGWKVEIHSRSKPSFFEFSKLWRAYTSPDDPPPQADVVIDTIPYLADDLAVYDPDAIGRLIAISTASVYQDPQGRSFDTQATIGFPEFADPITESTQLLPPGPESYSTNKVAMENRAVELFGDRATLLRPCAIYGKHSRQPREYWFVKRILDDRRRIPLMHQGLSQFQTTNVEDIAQLALLTAEQDIGGPFNIADETAPNVLEIGQTIIDFLCADPTTIELFPMEKAGVVGRTPWSVPSPFIISSDKALAVGLDQLSVYQQDAPDMLAWLAKLNPDDWRTAFPVLASYPYDQFDYAAEDRFFDELR
jgi:nucleoside-diphosphate-sugar epimerase